MGMNHLLVCLSCLILASVSRWTIQSLREAISNHFRGSGIMRTQSGERSYQQFRERMRASNTSVPAYIQSAKFGYSNQPHRPIYHIFNFTHQSLTIPVYILTDTPQQHLWISHTFSDSDRVRGLSRDSHFLLITINDFPYDLQGGIEHWLVWSNREVELSLVEALLQSITASGYKFLVYTNPPDKKSIPEIYHAQTFIYHSSDEL